MLIISNTKDVIPTDVYVMSQRIKPWCYFFQLTDNANEAQTSSKTKPLFSSNSTPFSSMFNDDLDDELEDDLIEEEDDAEMIRASSLFAKEVDGMCSLF